MEFIMTVKDIQEDRAEGKIALVSGMIVDEGVEFYEDVPIAEGVSAKMQKHKLFDTPAIATVGMPRGNELSLVLIHTSPEFIDFCATLFLAVQSQFLDKPIEAGPLTISLSDSKKISVWILPVQESVIRKIFPDLSAYYDEEKRTFPPYWQVVLSDPDGHFPWEVECAIEIVFGQQIFGNLDEEKARMLAQCTAVAYHRLVQLVQPNAPSSTAS